MEERRVIGESSGKRQIDLERMSMGRASAVSGITQGTSDNIPDLLGQIPLVVTVNNRQFSNTTPKRLEGLWVRFVDGGTV